MSNDYALFLGCTIPNRLPHLEVSTRIILKSLDVNVKDLPDLPAVPIQLVSLHWTDIPGLF